MEQLVDLLGGVLASNYTHASGTCSVTVTSGTMPASGKFSIRMNGGPIYTVSAVSGSGPYTLTLSAVESGTDVDLAAGRSFVFVLSTRGLAALIAESARKDLLSPASRAFAGGTMNPFPQPSKAVAVSAGATQAVLDVTSGGPGYLSDIWLAISDLASGHSADVVLKLTVDGVVTYNNIQSVFFGAIYWTDGGSVGTFANDYLQFWGGQGSRIPIPFNTSIKIEIINNGSGTIHLWWTGGYVTGVANDWPRCKNLVAYANAIGSLSQDAWATLIDVSGLPRGRLFGIFITWEGISASNSNFLEGEFKITLDGALAYQSSGGEDMFGMSGFFGGVSGGAGNSYQTLTIKRTSPPLFAAQRFFVGEPMNFENALKIELQAGMSSSGNTFTGTLTLIYTIFYYTE